MIYVKTEKMVKSFDGTSLYASTLIPATVKATVVIVHGLAEHLGRYDELANTFAENNFAVYRFDLRGHGKSEGQRAYFSNFTVIIEDVKFIVEMARNEHPQVPLFILGHSLGGFASAGFGSKYPNKADGIILSGALTNDNKGLIRSVPQGLAVTDYLPNELGHLICTDSSVVAAYQNDPLVLTQISAGLFYEIDNGVQWLKNNTHSFVAPTLILHGCDDQLVMEKDSRDFYGDIASTDKELKIYAKLYHEILNEPARHEIMKDIISWIKKRINV